MKPNKETNRIEFDKWSEELCKRRHDKLIELRKEKAENNPFKKWFYLGKKYSVEKYYDAPYDKLRWKAFKKWQKKVEKYGIEIKRPYFFYGKEKYKLWKSNNWNNCYKKFTSYWWKEVFDNIKRKFQYGYKIYNWDYYDIFNYLFVSLTIKGLFLGLYGNAVTHKEQMHEIWECRKELIKAYNYEDYYDWVHDVDVLRDSPNSNYYTDRCLKEELCIKNAFALLGKNIRNWWD